MRYSTQWDYDNMDDGYVDEPESDEEEESEDDFDPDDYEERVQAQYEEFLERDYGRLLDWIYK